MYKRQGKDIAGKPVVTDIAKMPHLLIAGATGSGKDVYKRQDLTQLLCRLLNSRFLRQDVFPAASVYVSALQVLFRKILLLKNLFRLTLRLPILPALTVK